MAVRISFASRPRAEAPSSRPARSRFRQHCCAMNLARRSPPTCCNAFWDKAGAAMKITHIETYPVRIPLKPARHMITALGKHTESQYLLVRVGTDAGIEGAGEATVMPTWSGETVWGARALIEHVFGPLLIGMDP